MSAVPTAVAQAAGAVMSVAPAAVAAAGAVMSVAPAAVAALTPAEEEQQKKEMEHKKARFKYGLTTKEYSGLSFIIYVVFYIHFILVLILDDPKL